MRKDRGKQKSPNKEDKSKNEDEKEVDKTAAHEQEEGRRTRRRAMRKCSHKLSLQLWNAQGHMSIVRGGVFLPRCVPIGMVAWIIGFSLIHSANLRISVVSSWRKMLLIFRLDRSHNTGLGGTSKCGERAYFMACGFLKGISAFLLYAMLSWFWSLRIHCQDEYTPCTSPKHFRGPMVPSPELSNLKLRSQCAIVVPGAISQSC